MIVNLHCCLCSREIEIEISIPHDWKANDVEITDSFCPEHSILNNFVENQCPGCVGSWSDCNLWGSFAYGCNYLTTDDFSKIRNGICPKRTNGTISVKNSKLSEIDYSNPASQKSGFALELAIKQYLKEYSDIDL
ncbi:MAG: hypothetical protein EHM72_12210 [Calditrichaeota bacterium]|nr:MAG: hypothetical protein EHM72_12210 [Calditrichota bacterium]